MTETPIDELALTREEAATLARVRVFQALREGQTSREALAVYRETMREHGYEEEDDDDEDPG